MKRSKSRHLIVGLATVALVAVLVPSAMASAADRHRHHRWHGGRTATVGPVTTVAPVTTLTTIKATTTTLKPTTTTVVVPTTVKATTTTTAAMPTPIGDGAKQTNCAPSPSKCGYPDATNSGVPAGLALKAVPGDVKSGAGWHWDDRGWVEIDGSGAVFSGFSVASGGLDVTASNVTITNNNIVVTGDGWGIGLRSSKNVTISHNTISSPAQTGTNRLGNGIRDIFGDADGVQIVGNNIFHANSGINHFDAGGLIQDNYIHDMGYLSGDHVNGIQLGSGTGPLMTIRHNTIFNQIDQTDAVMLATDDGPETNRIIDNNLLAGGGYTVYGAGGPQDVPTKIVFTNNRFSRQFFPNGGSFGVAAYFVASGAGNVWSGNYWDENLAPVNG